MGRELTDVHMDDSFNSMEANSNGDSDDKVDVGQKLSDDSIEVSDYEVKECTEENSFIEEHHEKQDVSSGENEKLGLQKSSDSESPSSSASESVKVLMHNTDPQPTEKFASATACSLEDDYMSSPKTLKNSQPSSPLVFKKTLQFDKKHADEDDNWSISSSTTGSARSHKSKVTIGKAPTFRSVERLEKRREFYSKLEEKHQALEAEKIQLESRMKEEQEAVLKQLRKNLVIKANPVPSFYYEGPPPKVELAKLPVTRAKSPKLGRRKSCGDSASEDGNGRACSRVHRHSFGNLKEESSSTSSPRKKDQSRFSLGGVKSGSSCTARNKGEASNGTYKVKDRSKAEETRGTASKKASEQIKADITVQ